MGAQQTAVNLATTVAIKGQIGDDGPFHIAPAVSEEASAEIPFGVMVKRGTADNGVLLCTSTADVFAGVVVHSQRFAKNTELGDTGLKPKVSFDVMRAGRIWVHVEESVTPSDKVYIRVIADDDVAGDFRKTAEASNCVDASAWCRFETSASGSEGNPALVLLSFNTNMQAA